MIKIIFILEILIQITALYFSVPSIDNGLISIYTQQGRRLPS